MGALPSKHNHAYQMVFTDRSAECEGCGQKWYLDVRTDKAGKKLTSWVPVWGTGQ